MGAAHYGRHRVRFGAAATAAAVGRLQVLTNFATVSTTFVTRLLTGLNDTHLHDTRIQPQYNHDIPEKVNSIKKLIHFFFSFLGKVQCSADLRVESPSVTTVRQSNGFVRALRSRRRRRGTVVRPCLLPGCYSSHPPAGRRCYHSKSWESAAQPLFDWRLS